MERANCFFADTASKALDRALGQNAPAAHIAKAGVPSENLI